MLFPFIQHKAVQILHGVGCLYPSQECSLVWGNEGQLHRVHVTWDQGAVDLGAMQTFCLKVSLGYVRIVRAMASP